jgi:hypothetical protein
MTRLLVFRFQVDQEEKFVRGKRDGLKLVVRSVIFTHIYNAGHLKEL